MTRKDYKKIAEVLRAWKPMGFEDEDNRYANAEYSQWSKMVEGFAMMLAKDNKKFNHDKFYRACDLYDGTDYPKKSDAG